MLSAIAARKNLTTTLCGKLATTPGENVTVEVCMAFFRKCFVCDKTH